MKLQLGFEGERFIYLPQEKILEMETNPLSEYLFICFLGYFNKAKHHFIDRPNGFGDYIFIYCVDGIGHVTIDGEQFVMCKNQFVILPPDISHTYYADDYDPWSIYWIHFRGSKSSFISNGCEKPKNLLPSQLSRIEQYLYIFEDIYKTLSGDCDINSMIYANLCFHHLLAIFTISFSEENQIQSSEYSSSIVNKAVGYMHENIYRQLSMREIATFIGYSPSHFYRRFIQETSLSPSEYYQQLKIRKAEELLKNSLLQINQISAKLGYKDSLYFSRIFSKYMGISPTSYRKNHKNNICPY